MTTCQVCAQPFDKARMGQIVCGIVCARRLPVITRKAEKVRTKERKEAAKPRSKWLAEAQVAFNAYIRKRDEFRLCISCGTDSGKMNAGHYRSVGSCPELRFAESNVHKQCERCNTYLHGNLLGYRSGLIDKKGLRETEWLEGPHPAKKYTVDALRTIRDKYRQKLKELAA